MNGLNLDELLKNVDWSKIKSELDELPAKDRGVPARLDFNDSLKKRFVPNEFTVHMDDIKWGDSSAILNTYALGGCYAIIVYASDKGKKRQGIMMHYFPTSILNIKSPLERVVKEHPSMKKADNKKAVIFYSDMESQNDTKPNYLECLLKSIFGGDVGVEKVKYSTCQMSGVPNWGQLYFNVKLGDWYSWEGKGNFEQNTVNKNGC